MLNVNHLTSRFAKTSPRKPLMKDWGIKDILTQRPYESFSKKDSTRFCCVFFALKYSILFLVKCLVSAEPFLFFTAYPLEILEQTPLPLTSQN